MTFHWYVDHILMEFVFCQSPYPITQSQSTRKDATSSPPRNLKRKKVVYAETSSSDDDTPLASSPVKPSKVNGAGKIKREDSGSMSVSDSEGAPKPKKAPNGRSKRPPRKKIKEESDTSDDDKPLETPKKRGPPAGKRKVKVEEDSDEEEEPAKPKAAPKPRRKKVKQEEEQEDASGAEAPKPKNSAKSKKVKAEESGSPVKGKGRKKEKKDEEEEEVFKWWEQSDPNGDGTVKWNTLEHHGVYFPPPYEPLPKNVKMKYNGTSGVQ